MNTTARALEFLNQLDESAMPVTVLSIEAIHLVKELDEAGLVQATVPKWDEETESYGGPAWVLRLTERGRDVAWKRPAV